MGAILGSLALTGLVGKVQLMHSRREDLYDNTVEVRNAEGHVTHV